MSKERKNEKRQIRKTNQEKSKLDAKAAEFIEVSANAKEIDKPQIYITGKTKKEAKQNTKEFVELIKNQYGDVLRKLGKT